MAYQFYNFPDLEPTEELFLFLELNHHFGSNLHLN